MIPVIMWLAFTDGGPCIIFKKGKKERKNALFSL